MNICDTCGATSLLKACQESTVQLLLQNGAEVYKSETFRTTPLLTARKNRHNRTVKLSLQHDGM